MGLKFSLFFLTNARETFIGLHNVQVLQKLIFESNWSSMSQSDDRASNIYWKKEIANWFCQNL